MDLGMLQHKTVNLNGRSNISYGETQDNISYGSYGWFYDTYKVLQDSKSDLAISVVTGKSAIDGDTFAVNLVKPVKVGFYTDQEPKDRVMILSAQHCLKDPEKVTKDTLLNIRSECFEVLGQGYKGLVRDFINDETISNLKGIIKELYAKKAKGSGSH